MKMLLTALLTDIVSLFIKIVKKKVIFSFFFPYFFWGRGSGYCCCDYCFGQVGRKDGQRKNTKDCFTFPSYPESCVRHSIQYLCYDSNEITALDKVTNCQSCLLHKAAIVFIAFNYNIMAIIFQLNYAKKKYSTVSLAIFKSIQ